MRYFNKMRQCMCMRCIEEQAQRHSCMEGFRLLIQSQYTSTKRVPRAGLRQGEEGTPIKQDVKKGLPRFYHQPIPWNYGMLPQARPSLPCFCWAAVHGKRPHSGFEPQVQWL